ncbi:ADP-glyceromanno-heptose 6-epimerase [Parasediminibacterium sp. JCM 36343]|uniref:ADP-glyceromanno-heptose 6-epimerase n=1 Tax=Parasediminibacterium sp. JCM 36343 TaxID=3374279 RepID=UPI0039793850
MADNNTAAVNCGYIIVTGAAGFIGSCMAQYLNEQGHTNLILVDDFGVEAKRVNWERKQFEHIVERQGLFEWLERENPTIDCFIHLGARTDTTEFDYAVHEALNVVYSQDVWHYCTANQVPLIYASSAATYGSGQLGYDDSHELPEKLQPLNPYGISKNEFDKWALKQTETPPFWAGLKFFNVYGPNEYHKGRMASVIWHSFNQIKKDGLVKLFKSHRHDFKDGEQLRDFVYVKDLVKVIDWLLVVSQNQSVNDLRLTTDHLRLSSGLYNLGTGTARSFYDLAAATFRGMDKEPNIAFVDMPIDIRDKYQYFTEANMQKLRNAGYTDEFYTLEAGVGDYVRNYLVAGKIY